MASDNEKILLKTEFDGSAVESGVNELELVLKGLENVAESLLQMFDKVDDALAATFNMPETTIPERARDTADNLNTLSASSDGAQQSLADLAAQTDTVSAGLKESAEQADKAGKSIATAKGRFEGVSTSANKAGKSLKEVGRTSVKTDDGFSKLTKGAAKLFAVLGGIVAVKKMFTGFIDAAYSLGTLSREIDVNVSELHAWGKAVELQGGSAAGFNSSVSNLNKTLYSFRRGEVNGSTDALRRLGVFATSSTSAIDALYAMSDKLSTLSMDDALKYGQDAGLDKDTIKTLMQGRSAVKALIDEQKKAGGLFNEADFKAAEDYKKTLTEIKQTGQVLFADLMKSAQPAIEALIKFVSENKEELSMWAQLLGKIIGVLITLALKLSIISNILYFTKRFRDQLEKVKQDFNALAQNKWIAHWVKTLKEGWQQMEPIFEALKEVLSFFINPTGTILSKLNKYLGNDKDKEKEETLAVTTKKTNKTTVYKPRPETQQEQQPQSYKPTQNPAPLFPEVRPQHALPQSVVNSASYTNTSTVGNTTSTTTISINKMDISGVKNGKDLAQDLKNLQTAHTQGVI